MSDIVDQMLEDPCSTLNDKDVEALRKVDKGTLKRLVLGLQTQQQSVQNQAEEPEDDEAAQITELQEELSSTQKNLVKLMGLEKEIRAALRDYGVKTNSVVERSVAVANQQAAHPQEMNPKMIWDWVSKSTNPTACMLREGLFALEQNRKKSIEVIVSNTSEYTEQELRRMSMNDLVKLARVLEVRNQQYSQDPIMSWEGMGLADQAVNQTPALRVVSGGTLDIPSTSSGPLPDQRY